MHVRNRTKELAEQLLGVFLAIMPQLVDHLEQFFALDQLHQYVRAAFLLEPIVVVDVQLMHLNDILVVQLYEVLELDDHL
jgi:hypothetical protein